MRPWPRVTTSPGFTFHSMSSTSYRPSPICGSGKSTRVSSLHRLTCHRPHRFLNVFQLRNRVALIDGVEPDTRHVLALQETRTDEHVVEVFFDRSTEQMLGEV